MKTRYTILLSLGITVILIILLFVPISVTVPEPKLAEQAKRATISLVDRIAPKQTEDVPSLVERKEREPEQETLIQENRIAPKQTEDIPSLAVRKEREPEQEALIQENRIAPKQTEDIPSLAVRKEREPDQMEQEKVSDKVTSTSEVLNDEVSLSQMEVKAATQSANQESPTLINGIYYPVESVTIAPIFDRALLASRIVYPPLAKRQKKEGLVILRLFIAPSGLVERVVVEEDPGYGLSESAVAAFTSFKVSPALHNNEPVAVTLRYPVRFTLQ